SELAQQRTHEDRAHERCFGERARIHLIPLGCETVELGDREAIPVHSCLAAPVVALESRNARTKSQVSRSTSMRDRSSENVWSASVKCLVAMRGFRARV